MSREWLERCLRRFQKGEYECSQLAKDIENFFSIPEPKQDDEPVAWLSPTSKTFSTVETSHHTAPLFLHPEAKNPSEMESSKEKILELAHRWCSRYRHGDEFPYLFNEYHLLQFVQRLHPAPRKEFVRLSQEEIQTIYLTRYDTPNLFARAIEDALEEKNR